MGVRADDTFPGGHQALFRQKGVLHAHLAYIIEVVQIKLPGEGAALEALLGGLDVLVGGEMVHDHGDFVLSNTLVKPSFSNSLDGHGEVMSLPRTMSSLARIS